LKLCSVSLARSANDFQKATLSMFIKAFTFLSTSTTLASWSRTSPLI
jgi:hypothetical protein